MKSKIMIIKILLFFFLLFSLPVAVCRAQTFSSSSYRIDWGNFNITSGKKNSSHYQLTDTVGQNAPGQYNSSSFTVKSGFQYIFDSNNSFSFKISSLAINFGILVPNIGATQTNLITISTPSGHGYDILALENHPLWVNSSVFIPNTPCDAGNCSDTVSGIWNSGVGTTGYGFGFNAIGVDVSGNVTGVGTSSIFTDSTYFRQFADVSAARPARSIMSENIPVSKHSARITYKAYISPRQTAGYYQNAVNFIAIPKY